MEMFGVSGTVVGCNTRKKRSNLSRRPRNDSQIFSDSYSLPPLSFIPPLGSGNSDQNQNCIKSGLVSDGLGCENKLRKLKLKVGGVTHTVHTKSTTEVAFSGGSSGTNSAYTSGASWPLQKPIFQENEDGIYSLVPDSNVGRKRSGGSVSLNEIYKNEPVRKSKRVLKRRNLDMGFNNDGDDDEEIRSLGKLNASKVASNYEDEEKEGNEGKWRSSMAPKSSWMDDSDYSRGAEDYRSTILGRDKKKKPRSEKMYEDKDYFEEEEPISDDEFSASKKRLRKESPEMFTEGRKELTLVTRKRASEFSASLVDLPNGLPPAPPKKQKDKLSEVEQQLKKAEAAQRRRMQSEKAAREAEAEAIRKILGQDSSRKKKEEKMKRQREELAEVRAANNFSIASNTVRWIIGPSGTVVTFSEDIGLPNILNQVACSYPPPREKCVGPNCTNVYRYRDSKSRLPLCSLHCYKAIHEKMQPLIAC